MVIRMKEFYIFNIKEEFYKLYKEKPSELFFILNRIYNMKPIDKEYGYNLFSQISNFLDKKEINKLLNIKYADKIMYSYNNNEHIINNLFKNEISILTIKNANIKIDSNLKNPSFLKDLEDLKGAYFVCDFKEKEYFFIKRNKIKAI